VRWIICALMMLVGSPAVATTFITTSGQYEILGPLDAPTQVDFSISGAGPIFGASVLGDPSSIINVLGLASISNGVNSLSLSYFASNCQQPGCYDRGGLSHGLLSVDDSSRILEIMISTTPSQYGSFSLLALMHFIPGISIVPYTPSVPELSTWAMLLIGFAGIGFAGYRRKRNLVMA